MKITAKSYTITRNTSKPTVVRKSKIVEINLKEVQNVYVDEIQTEKKLIKIIIVELIEGFGGSIVYESELFHKMYNFVSKQSVINRKVYIEKRLIELQQEIKELKLEQKILK
jgi:4-aminobutyrate aminotransferase-like enzyme